MNKLKKHIIRFFSITLSIVILMTTSGFSIYTHHCNHNHTNYYSLFVPSHSCNMHAPKPVVQRCCHKQAPTAMPNCDTSPNDNGCCSNKTQVVKLNTKTLVSNTTSIIKPIETPSFIMIIAFHTNSIEISNTTISAHQCAESPPPLTTAEFLSYIQVYNI